MALAYVNSAQNMAGSVIATTCSTGNIIVVVMAGGAAAVVTDTALSTYTLAITKDNGSGLNVQIFVCKSVLGNNVTITSTAGADIQASWYSKTLTAGDPYAALTGSFATSATPTLTGNEMPTESIMIAAFHASGGTIVSNTGNLRITDTTNRVCTVDNTGSATPSCKVSLGSSNTWVGVTIALTEIYVKQAAEWYEAGVNANTTVYQSAEWLDTAVSAPEIGITAGWVEVAWSDKGSIGKFIITTANGQFIVTATNGKFIIHNTLK